MTARQLLPVALFLTLTAGLFACGEPEDSKPDSGDTDTDTDADTDTDTDTDADTDADADLGLLELIQPLDGVDTGLGPFDAINSDVTCGSDTWTFSMLDSDGAAEQGWVVGWDLGDGVVTPPVAMTYNAGSSHWGGSVSTADFGLSCDRFSSTVIYFLPIAGNMLGKKAATKVGTCTGTGFGMMGEDYLLNVSTSTPVDAATAQGYHMWSGFDLGPLDMSELSSDTWDTFFQWDEVQLSTFGQEALFGMALYQGDTIVGVGGV